MASSLFEGVSKKAWFQGDPLGRSCIPASLLQSLRQILIMTIFR
jgi:hypothetical protein